MPEPNYNESRSDFIDRCMSDEEAQTDFPKNNQRLAFCSSVWDNKKNNNNEIEIKDTYSDYPKAATNNARRAKDWLEKNDNPNDCLTAVGFKRMNQLANREALSRDVVSRMAQFKRHQQYKDVPYDEGCGGIAWDAWGGDAGINWAIRTMDKLKKMKKDYNYRNLNNTMSIKDVDTKSRIVAGYFSAFNNVDSDGDLIKPGAFTKSINERGPGSSSNRKMKVL